MNKLTPVKHKWYQIGIQLGMSNEELKVLQQKPSGCEFYEMLEIWLRGGTGVPTTWQSLVVALKSPDVDKPKLGLELQGCYCLNEQGISALIFLHGGIKSLSNKLFQYGGGGIIYSKCSKVPKMS